MTVWMNTSGEDGSRLGSWAKLGLLGASTQDNPLLWLKPYWHPAEDIQLVVIHPKGTQPTVTPDDTQPKAIQLKTTPLTTTANDIRPNVIQATDTQPIATADDAEPDPIQPKGTPEGHGW